MLLEALLQVIERLIALAKGRIEGRRAVFDRVIEPTFNDLLSVHGDYIAMFEQAQVFAGSWPNTELEIQARVEAAKTQIRQRRREFEPVRRKLETLAQELKTHNLPVDERNFLEAVLRYLPSGETSLPQSSATAVLEYLDTAAPEQIDLLLAQTIQQHLNRWSQVCTTFAKARVAVAEAR
ncbi:MAG: hypothetical protein DMF56_23815 [Acidobacteria bacterium]|nr:MAG: hypothetical protein DMF56_23815 [Acidobacteriota bacterium]